MSAIRKEGEYAVDYARKNGKRIMILAGRPYHIDPEIGHGIDKLAVSLGFVVVSEDSICHLTQKQKVRVLNQWTYHARLYRAARFASENPDVQLVQLVSFGCGVDAITTDEVREILESNGKIVEIPLPEEFSETVEKAYISLISSAIDGDEKLMADFIENKLPDAEQLKKSLRKKVLSGDVVPVLYSKPFHRRLFYLLQYPYLRKDYR